MKTLEFKLDLTQAEAQVIDLWADQLRWVWNQGLSLLEEDQQRRWRKKNPIDEDVEQVPWYWHRNADGSFGLACECTVYRNGELRPACLLRQHMEVEDPAKQVSKIQTNAANPDKPWLHAICSRFRNGVIDSLKKAWKAYLDPKHPARRPRYKGKRDTLRSLTNLNGGGKTPTVHFQRIVGEDGNSTDNAYAQFPVLGKLRVKGLFKRLAEGQEHGACRIVREPSGYYLQVCASSKPIQLKPSDKAVGVDPGLKSLIATDAGKEVKPAQLLRKQQKRLRRLQRKAAYQEKGSNSQKQTYRLIARTHEKIRRSRNAFNHKVSTKLVREYGAIAFEDIQLKNLVRRPKAKPKEDGSGYERNNASAKSGLNKSFADAAIGDLRAKIEAKAKVGGREFVRPPAPKTTINCSGCGVEVPKLLSQRVHRCLSCGLEIDRDVNAARNILAKGRELFSGVYRTWVREVKRVDRSKASGKKQKPEATQVAPEHELLLPASLTSSKLQSTVSSLRDSGGVSGDGKATQPCSPIVVGLSAFNDTQAIRATQEDPSPSTSQLPGSEQSSSLAKPRKGKRKRSAQPEPQLYEQLGLWDTAGENQLENG